MRNRFILVLFAMATTLLSCDKEEVDGDQLIQDYLLENNLEAERTEEGLYYIITREGNGESPNIASTVTAHYKGYLRNGDIFDSSYDRGKTSTFPLTGVIEGWQIGMPLMTEEGAATLLIPGELGYGKNPPPNSIIGEDEVLLFDIELIEVEK
jgi:FKBP-type peptidyl-prolyl cis-trans isomerase FkpA